LSFLPEDRGAELRNLFFESAAELLQVINDTGMQLEKRPADEELIRSVRRAVHTLKGDSAACGFQKLSELSHELEDVLSLQISQTHGPLLAEVILAAVDTFESMLGAYQKRLDPPSGEPLRVLIHNLLQAPNGAKTDADGGVAQVPASFRWNEYESLMVSEALLPTGS
jgi:two-component system chemotaxis sensor kinase CheA